MQPIKLSFRFSKQGIFLFIKLKKNMKNQLMPRWDNLAGRASFNWKCN